MPTRRFHRLALSWAMFLALGACGGAAADTAAPTLASLEETSSDAAAAATTTAPIDPEVAFQEFAACMREHGIDVPDPEDGEGGFVIGGAVPGDGGSVGEALGPDAEAFDEANKACGTILEDAFGEFELTPETEAEGRDQQLAFAQCMRDNGVEDWPDPSGDGPIAIELGPDVDPETLNTATDTCAGQVFGDDGPRFGVGRGPGVDNNVDATP